MDPQVSEDPRSARYTAALNAQGHTGDLPLAVPNLQTATIHPLAQVPMTWPTERPCPFPLAAVTNPTENDFVCPVCGRPMRLLTVLRHAPGEQTFAVQCRPCGLSTTTTVDAPRQSDSAR